MTQSTAQTRRKGIGVKVWLFVSETGESRLEEVGKHYIMRRTSLPARDLRILDPMLSQPSSILGREKAIVINLEHIKAIITATEILMINSSNPLFLQFLQDLQSRISTSSNEMPHRMSNDMDTNDYSTNTMMEVSFSLNSRTISQNNSPMTMHEGSDFLPDKSNIEIKWGSSRSGKDVPVASPPKQLPFEFKALEACLESACRCLESETKTLEDEAYPALDELTSKISTLNLERVRQIKSRLVALSGRVQKVRDQIEHLLDDDHDMAEMYLTQKLETRLVDQTSLKEGYNTEFDEDEDQSDESHSKRSYNSSDPKLDVEELEMLLEAYFAQINGILQKLSSLSEYVDDTEDYINIMLDDKRNQLLQVAVIYGTLNMMLNAGIVVVGLFGMNIHIDLFDGQPYQFWSTTWGTLAGCLFLFFLSIYWGKKKYLLSS
ncbi:PREDICTED: magnesium transporter MRS2-F-like [Lupinus angustifolius]|uniref:magnesium transporter MRS2-F-like n=1 Tax=Lupinus angustifolius TaxID=3871 RepID=UPI00092F5B95|nr:PREDICTED: magnesium transporter MRS2-F-like [Lupinus angustifolius]